MNIQLKTAMLLAITLAAACSRNAGMNPASPPRIMKVLRGELAVIVSATGEVEPEYKVEVKSKASGEILEFPFEPGDGVKKGQPLVRLDQKTEKRSVAQAEADLARAHAEVKSAQADLLEKQLNLKRVRSLFEKSLVSGQEMDSAVAREASAQAAAAQAHAAAGKAALALEDARDRLRDTVIVSPIDGIIVEKAVERGQLITSGMSSLTGGARLMTLADMSRLYVSALVDETDVGKISTGQNAKITVDTYPGQVFEGVLRRIYPTGETKDNITVFRAKVEVVDQKKDMLRPGMTANVDVTLESRQNALYVPDEAIAYAKGSAREGAVTVKSGSKNVERKVTLGISNGFETEILTGLTEGEQVVVAPPAVQE